MGAGEALCRKYSNADDLSCIAMRVRTTHFLPELASLRRVALLTPSHPLSWRCPQFTSPREHTAAQIAVNIARCVDAPPDVKYDLVNWVELEDDSTVIGAPRGGPRL